MYAVILGSASPAVATETSTPPPPLEMLEYLGEWGTEVTLDPALLERALPTSTAPNSAPHDEQAP